MKDSFVQGSDGILSGSTSCVENGLKPVEAGTAARVRDDVSRREVTKCSPRSRACIAMSELGGSADSFVSKETE